jgi:hypothetical protein
MRFSSRPRPSLVRPAAMNDVVALRDEVRRLHNCDAVHGATLPVMDLAEGKLIWDGPVEYFHLKDHPTATGCYAWTERLDEGSLRRVVVLKSPPIMSANEAVRASISAELQATRV